MGSWVYFYIFVFSLSVVWADNSAIIRSSGRPGSTSPKISRSAKKEFEKELAAGNRLFAKFDSKGALPHFEKAHELDRMNYEAHMKLLRLNNSIGQDFRDREKDLEQAELYFRRNIEIAEELKKNHPENAEAWFAIAVAYGNLALYSPAEEKVKLAQHVEEYLKKSVRLDPNYPYAYLGLGIFYREVSRITFLERFFANLLFGAIPKGDLEMAEANFKEALKRDPDFPFARYHYGKCLEYAERDADAVREYELAIKTPKKDFSDDYIKKLAHDAIENLQPGYFAEGQQKADASTE